MQFKEGDWVYLKIQPYRKVTLSVLISQNFHLGYGPYQILQKVGYVEYKLSLPPQLLLHPTFHVLQLKLCHHLPANISHPPVLDISSPYCPNPHKIIDRRIVQKGNKAVTQVLVQWNQLPSEQATWEDYHSLMVMFPSFLEDKEDFDRGI